MLICSNLNERYGYYIKTNYYQVKLLNLLFKPVVENYFGLQLQLYRQLLQYMCIYNIVKSPMQCNYNIAITYGRKKGYGIVNQQKQTAALLFLNVTAKHILIKFCNLSKADKHYHSELC